MKCKFCNAKLEYDINLVISGKGPYAITCVNCTHINTYGLQELLTTRETEETTVEAMIKVKIKDHTIELTKEQCEELIKVLESIVGARDSKSDFERFKKELNDFKELKTVPNPLINGGSGVCHCTAPMHDPSYPFKFTTTTSST